MNGKFSLVTLLNEGELVFAEECQKCLCNTCGWACISSCMPCWTLSCTERHPYCKYGVSECGAYDAFEDLHKQRK
jgi:hypothetical protein